MQRGRERVAFANDLVRRYPYLLPALVLLMGAAFRFYNLNWDSGHQLHPDERFIYELLAGGAGNPPQPPISWPTSISQFLNIAHGTGSPLDPHFFAYGSLPIYILALISGTIATIGQHVPGLSAWASANTYTYLPSVGRAVSAIFDLTTVFLVFLLGRRVFGYWTGVLAMTLSAFTVLDIQLAHFYTVDTLLTPLVLLTLLGAVEICRSERRGPYIWAGIAFGAALATKTTALLLVLPLGAAAVLSAFGGAPWPRGGSLWARVWKQYRAIPRQLNANLQWLLAAYLVGALTFAICEPYAILDRTQLVSDLQQQTTFLVTNNPPFAVPFTIQYAGTTPYLYQLKNMLFWSMGIPLALAAFVGFVYFAVRALRFRVRPEQAVLLLWVAGYFLFVGRFFAKFNRYMLPIIPVIILFGAALLVHLVKQRRPAPRRIAAAAIGAVTLLSFLYSLAYTNIYANPNTRVAASSWIFAHIPPGSSIADEGPWDDPLPLDENGHVGGQLYHFTNLDMYAGETSQVDEQNKLHNLIDVLTHYQYIISSSERLIGSIPRLPERYPVTLNFYHLLFANKLNFRLVKVFQQHPQLGPFVVHDYPADESFHVYDHPIVRIFQRIGTISPAAARRLLTSNLPSYPNADPATLPWILRPVQPQPDHRLMLSPAQWHADQQGETYDHMFPAAGFAMQHPLLIWLLVLELLGLLALPFAFLLFSHLLDRGFVIGKTLGLVILGYLVWIGVSAGVAQYTRGFVWSVLAALVIASIALAHRTRTSIVSAVTSQWRYMVAGEVVFLVGFVAFALLRMWYPDLGHQFSPVGTGNMGGGRMGEKQMELAFVNAISRSRVFPPYDPFFAGGYINYYYYGFFLVATLCKLAQIAPATGFNLAIATFFALLVAGAFSVVLTLTRRITPGVLAAIFVAVIGNLNGAWQLVRGLWSVATVHSDIPLVGGVVDTLSGIQQVVIAHQSLPPFDFWESTRIVPGGAISEFPFFTYLFADLHPHLMAYPMALAAIAIAVNLLRGGYPSFGRRSLALLLTGLLVGAIAVTNPWDFPTYLVVLALGAAVGVYAVRRHPVWEMLTRPTLWAVGASLLALILYLPFKQSYQTVFSTGVGLVRDITPQLLYGSNVCPQGVSACPDVAHDILVTPLRIYLEHFGFFLFGILSYAVLLVTMGTRGTAGLRRWVTWAQFALYYRDRIPAFWRALRAARAMRGGRPPGSDEGSVMWGAVLLIAGLLVLGFYLLAFTTTALLIVSVAGYRLARDLRSGELFALSLAAFALLISIATQIFFFKDFLAGGAQFRMNTIFKFYDQAWVLFAISTATALYYFMARQIPRRQAAGRGNVRQSSLYPASQRRRTGLAWERHGTHAPAEGTGPARFDTPISAPAAHGSTALAPQPLDRQVLTSLGSDPLGEAVAETIPEGTTAGARLSRRGPSWPSIPAMARPIALFRRRGWWTLAAALLASGSLIYTYSGTISRETYRTAWLPENSVPFTLDGMAFMKAAYPGDDAAIQWLNQHVAGAQVIAESGPSYYDWRSRVSMFTGLPTIINGIHEAEQRYDDELNPQSLCAGARNPDACTQRTHARADDLTTLYDSPSTSEARRVIRQYGVRYIYVGFLERQCVQQVQCYSPQGLAKFDAMVGHGLSVAYRREGVTIYEVTRA